MPRDPLEEFVRAIDMDNPGAYFDSDRLAPVKDQHRHASCPKCGSHDFERKLEKQDGKIIKFYLCGKCEMKFDKPSLRKSAGTKISETRPKTTKSLGDKSIPDHTIVGKPPNLSRQWAIWSDSAKTRGDKQKAEKAKRELTWKLYLVALVHIQPVKTDKLSTLRDQIFKLVELTLETMRKGGPKITTAEFAKQLGVGTTAFDKGSRWHKARESIEKFITSLEDDCRAAGER